MIPGFPAALLVVLAAIEGNVEATAEETVRFLEAFESMADRIEAVRDYTCVFTKQELLGGAVHPENTIFMKHRGPSVCVYMKWIEEPHLGRESIYCDGRYGNELQVHEGSGIASWMTLSLDPEGSLATRESRRPITEAGVYNTVRSLRDGFAAARKENRARGFRRVYEIPIHHQPSICAETLPSGSDDAGVRVGRSEICIHRELRLPTKIALWDEAGNLLGKYTYRDYRLNVGLTDHDFDVENEEYGF